MLRIFKNNNIPLASSEMKIKADKMMRKTARYLNTKTSGWGKKQKQRILVFILICFLSALTCIVIHVITNDPVIPLNANSNVITVPDSNSYLIRPFSHP